MLIGYCSPFQTLTVDCNEDTKLLAAMNNQCAENMKVFNAKKKKLFSKQKYSIDWLISTFEQAKWFEFICFWGHTKKQE